MASFSVKVPQKDGEITVRSGGNEPVTYRVVDGAIAARSKAEAQSIAALVGGTIEEAK